MNLNMIPITFTRYKRFTTITQVKDVFTAGGSQTTDRQFDICHEHRY
jgi:hypothetical protein